MVCAGKLVPAISTEVAFRHVNRPPPVPWPLEVAHATRWLLGSHRIPISLRHRNLDRYDIANCIKGIQCLLVLDAHRQYLRAPVKTYDGSRRGQAVRLG
jgi:hypothetical protein